MSETSTSLNVVQALNAARLEVGSVGKDGRAPAQMGGYRFRGVDAVVNAASAVLARHGVLVTPEVLDVERVTTTAKGGAQMLNVYVRTRFTFHGPAGDTVSAIVLGEASDAGDKATAKAQSVALRVALLQALLLPTDDPDPDAEGYQRATRQEVLEQETEAQRVLRERRTQEGPAERSGYESSTSAQRRLPAPPVAQEAPAGPPPIPAHLGPFYEHLGALAPSQKVWVQTNWPPAEDLPQDPRQMTTAQAARALEWLAASVPPPVTVPA